MEMEKICIELPIVRVESSQPTWSCDFAKEHYEVGLQVVDDGVMHSIVFYNGECVWNIPCPHDVIERYLAEKAIRDNDAIYHRDMEAIEDKLRQIATLIERCSDKGDTVVTNFVAVKNDIEEMRDDLIDTIDERFSNLPKNGGDGANVLDVAKAFAVISKPELIKELNK